MDVRYEQNGLENGTHHICFMMHPKGFCTNVSWIGKYVEAQILHITLYIAPNYTIILFPKQRNYTHSCMFESILLSTIHTPLLPYNLALIFFVVDGAQVRGLINYAYIALNKFKNLNVDLTLTMRTLNCNIH